MHVEIQSVHNFDLYAADVLQTHHSLTHCVSMLVITLSQNTLEEFVIAECVIIIIIIIIISLFKEDYILSKHTYLTYGPL